MKKNLLVILLVLLSIFTFVSCKDDHDVPATTANVYVSGGYIRVSFNNPQEVEEHTASYDGKTLVSYKCCTSAYPVIPGLEVIEAVSDYINGLTLVATDDTNKNFKLAFTLDGFLMRTIGALLDQVLSILPENVEISYSQAGGEIVVNQTGDTIVVSVPAGLSLATQLQLNFPWDNLEFAPIYITEDILGIASDYFAGNLDNDEMTYYKEANNNTGVAPLRTINVVSSKNGQVFGYGKINKVNAVIKPQVGVAPHSIEFTGLAEGVTYYFVPLQVKTNSDVPCIKVPGVFETRIEKVDNDYYYAELPEKPVFNPPKTSVDEYNDYIDSFILTHAGISGKNQAGAWVYDTENYNVCYNHKVYENADFVVAYNKVVDEFIDYNEDICDLDNYSWSNIDIYTVTKTDSVVYGFDSIPAAYVIYAKDNSKLSSLFLTYTFEPEASHAKIVEEPIDYAYYYSLKH